MQDHFSQQAALYRLYRPIYPQYLFDFILQQTPQKERAWDCGTGNGQVAAELAKHFSQVDASDLSLKQLQHAPPTANIHYHQCPASQSPFPDQSFDLITVAQALHWFDIDAFYKEAQRLAKKSALLAVWGYGMIQIQPNIDQLVEHFYKEVVGEYWPEERKQVETHYRNIPFPFPQIEAPTFAIQSQWTLSHLLGYLKTWSSTNQFMKKNGFDPVDQWAETFEAAWDGEYKKAYWPIFFQMGKLN